MSDLLWKELLIRLTICFFVISISNFCCFPCWCLLLIKPAPVHCLPFTFQQNQFESCLQRCEKIIIEPVILFVQGSFCLRVFLLSNLV